MKIAIIGSRNWKDEQAIVDFIDTLPNDTLVISGGAPGVDTIAISAAQLRGLDTLVYPADWQKWGREAGMIRNGEMIKGKPDMVAAFRVNRSKKSSGTDDMIKKAKSAAIPVVINPTEYVAPTTQRKMF